MFTIQNRHQPKPSHISECRIDQKIVWRKIWKFGCIGTLKGLVIVEIIFEVVTQIFFVIPLKLHLNVLIIAKNNNAKHNTAPDP